MLDANYQDGRKEADLGLVWKPRRRRSCDGPPVCRRQRGI